MKQPVPGPRPETLAVGGERLSGTRVSFDRASGLGDLGPIPERRKNGNSNSGSLARQSSRSSSSSRGSRRKSSRRSAAQDGATAAGRGTKKAARFAEEGADRGSLRSETWQPGALDDGEESDEDSGSTDCSDDEEDEQEVFWLSPIWYELVNSTAARNTRRMRTLSVALENGIRESEASDTPSHPWSVHPDKHFRAFWNKIGCLMFLYDAILLPLLLLEASTKPEVNAISWVVRLYWTLDIAVGFLTGAKQQDGTVDFRPMSRARHYFRTWFFFDLSIVTIDWVEECWPRGTGYVRGLLALLRLFRLGKVIRHFAVPALLESHLERSGMEVFLIIFSIGKILLGITWVAHLIACIWYRLGTLGAENGVSTNWMEANGLAQQDAGFLYAMCFLWGLATFTGQSNIFPTNIMESVFTIVTMLFTFVVSISAVSIITTLMSQAYTTSELNSAQFKSLRAYLQNNEISQALSLRVQRNAHHAAAELRRNTAEASVELLALVSEPLHAELHYELNQPVMQKHPFFLFFDNAYKAAARQLCHQGISRSALHAGDILFSCGEMPEEPRMFFVVAGRMLYMREGQQATVVQAGEWVCEPLLWTPWVYRGLMCAKSACTVMQLDTRKFQTIVCQSLSADADPRKYGKELVKHLNATPRGSLTDLNDPDFDSCEVAARVMVPDGNGNGSGMGRRSSTNFFQNQAMMLVHSISSSAGKVVDRRESGRRSLAELMAAG